MAELITVPFMKLGGVVLQSDDQSDALSAVFQYFTNYVVVRFAEILRSLEPPPVIPSGVEEFFGNYVAHFFWSTSYFTIALQYVPESKYEQIVLVMGAPMVLKWVVNTPLRLLSREPLMDVARKKAD